MYFEQNAQALLSANPANAAVLKALENVEAITEFELLSCPDGGFTLRYQGMCLHNPESPIAEVRQTIEQQATLAADRIHAVLGLGLGYLPDELIQKTPGQMVIYEPDLALLRFVLENVDLTQLFASPKVALFCEQEAFLAYLRKKLYGQYKLDILTLKGCAYLLAKEIEPLMENLTRIEMFRIQDFKTGQHFHELWIRQFFENSPHFAQMHPLDVVAEAFLDKPALIISRGPSLDYALLHIKALAASTVLIAVGGALRRLHDEGITPDFALFYDANGMREQIHGLSASYLENITFVASPFTQPDVFDTPSRGKLLMLAQNNTQLVDYLDQAFHHKHVRLGGGGTVSIIGFQMAQAMRCNPIILVGQDLAFTNNQVYAGGVAVRLNEKGQLDLESTEQLYTAPAGMTTVVGQDGNPLSTLHSFKSFLIHLEEMAVENAKSERPITLWNTSLGGAHIEGFPLRDLSQFVGQFPDWKNLDGFLFNPQQEREQVQERTDHLLKAAKNLESELKGHIAFLRELNLKAGRNQNDVRKLADDMLKANQAIYARFIEAPFTAYLLLHELREFRERFQDTLSAPDGPMKAQKEIRKFLTGSVELLQIKILPAVQSSITKLEAIPKLESSSNAQVS